MADPKKDDLADALAAFAGGEVSDTGEHTAAPGHDVHHNPLMPPAGAPTPRPRPATQRPAAPVAPPTPSRRPVTPGAPAPQPVAAPQPSTPPAYIRPRALPANLGTRRTLIPILLTCGVLLIVFGGLKWMTGPDSPFATLPMSVIASAFGMGLLLLLVAAINMMSVKSAMEQVK